MKQFFLTLSAVALLTAPIFARKSLRQKEGSRQKGGSLQ